MNKLTPERLNSLLHTLDGEFSTRLLAAVRFAMEAGQQTLERFQKTELQVEKKNDRSPVTVADKEAELLLRERIPVSYTHLTLPTTPYV